MKRKTVLFILIILMTLPMVLMAEEGGSEGVSHKNTLSTTLAVYGSGGVEAKEEYVHTIRIPFGGTGMLTSGNNMEIKPKVSLSPVAVTPGLDIVVTPLAILQIMAGGEIGSGWYLPILGGVNGVGVLDYPTDSSQEDYRSNVYTHDAFSGFKWKIKFGGAFQFDTGAVIPGDWSHVVIRTYHEAYYQEMTQATGDLDFWEYEIGKDNLNSMKYYANYLLGYSTPAVPVLELVGILFETETMISEQRNESTIAQEGWASDLWDYKLAALINCKFNDAHGLATLIQFNTTPNWKDPGAWTTLDANELARPYREIDSTNPYLWQFYRVALVYSLSF